MFGGSCSLISLSMRVILLGIIILPKSMYVLIFLVLIFDDFRDGFWLVLQVLRGNFIFGVSFLLVYKEVTKDNNVDESRS